MSRVTLGARIDAIETLIAIVSGAKTKPSRAQIDMLVDRARQGVSCIAWCKNDPEAKALIKKQADDAAAAGAKG